MFSRAFVRAGFVVLLVAAISVMTSPSRLHAQGLQVAWDHCSSAGITTKSFACNDDSGVDTIVVSILPDFNLPRVVSIGVDGFVCFSDLSVPSWWQVLEPTNCRYGALSVVAASPVSECGDSWQTDTAPVLTHLPFTVLNGLKFIATVRVTDASLAKDFVQGHEVELFRLALAHTGTVGPSACDGCSTAANIGFDYSHIFTADGQSLGWSRGRQVTWQDPEMACRAITPTRSRTWGELKAIYR